MANVGELKVSRLAHRETFTRSQKGRLAPFFPRVPPLVLQQLCGGGNRWSVLFPKFSPRIILDPPTVQVPAAQRPLPLCGLWRGTYGSHGVELLHVEAAPGGLSLHLREGETHPLPALEAERRGAIGIVAKKITGDSFVVAGKVGLTDMWRSHTLSFARSLEGSDCLRTKVGVSIQVMR